MEGGTFLSDALQKEFGRFVLIELHTDGRSEEMREASLRHRELQRSRFSTVALPYYALLDPTGETVLWQGGGRMAEEDFLKRLQAVPQPR